MSGHLRGSGAVVVLALVLAQACTGAPPSRNQVIAELTDYAITLDRQQIPPGPATIGVRNRSAQTHQLTILKTDLAPDQLPIDSATQTAREDGRVGGIATIPAGQSASVNLDLVAGHYVVLCNLPTHYGLGMHTQLTVH